MSTLLLSVFFAVTASAYDVEVDGLYYNLNETEKTAEVTYKEHYKASYSGSVEIPSSIVINEVEYKIASIGEYAFYNCTGLTSITIPNSVTNIGEWAFHSCSGLTSITIPNSVTSIGDYTFQVCSNLTSITIPNSVTSIGNGAFHSCSGLTSITIPNSVTSIGGSAFSHCSGLTSITIPNSVTSIGDYAFYDCSGLTSITIPNSVTNIGEWAFYECTNLISITIPNSVTSIGDYAFSGCSGLTSITIPNSVTNIGEWAFYGCSGLTSITIPNSVTNIGSSAFSNCIYLTSITIPNSVTSIGDSAFKSCSGLTSITIPNSVTSIGNSAFYDCSGLTSITIPNSVTSIGNSAFYGCIGLTSITIPNSVTSIDNYAFSDCTGLTSITIPNSVTRIGEGAFFGCINLSSVTIPNSVTSIEDYAFSGCKINKLYFDCLIDPNINLNYLKELIVGDNTSIVYDYFKYANLTKIILGKNVTHIRTEAFYTSKLEEFTITGEEPPYLYPNVFGSQDLSKATLYVPESKVEYYQTTEPWSNFGKVLTLSCDTPAEPKKCATPSVQYSDGKLQFSCETEGAKCHYTISCPDAASGETSTENNSVTLNAYYDITCYAKAEGFANSDIVTAKLYWLTSSGSLDSSINAAKTRGVVIQSAAGFITISGLDSTEQVDFFASDGKALGSAKAIGGTATFAAQSGSVVVAKIGKENVKIAVK